MLELHVHVPGHGIPIGPVDASVRQPDDRALPLVELLAVAEVDPQPLAHLELVPLVEAEIPGVEEGVDIRAQEQPVADLVLAVLGDRPDVRRLKGGTQVAARDRAAPVVGREDEPLEALLARPAPDELG